MAICPQLCGRGVLPHGLHPVSRLKSCCNGHCYHAACAASPTPMSRWTRETPEWWPYPCRLWQVAYAPTGWVPPSRRTVARSRL